jgi:hypothetical protein
VGKIAASATVANQSDGGQTCGMSGPTRERPRRSRARRIVSIALTAALAALGVAIFIPGLLVFPYHQRVGDTDVYSESPIPTAMAEVLRRAERRLSTSPIAGEGHGGPVFLTDGGWRWHVLALTSSGAFAITRPLSEAVVVNRSEAERDVVRNGRAVGGERSLSGVIAHERTHSLIRAHFGLLADWRYPAELREGYCDFVAGGGSLSDQAARALQQSGEQHPALIYYLGRKRVELLLPHVGGSVDRLFQEWNGT